MIPDIRKMYNRAFTDEHYNAMFESLWKKFNKRIEFKVCETPAFIPDSLKRDLIAAGEEIIDVIVQDDFKSRTDRSIPENLYVPGEDAHTVYLALDFGICTDSDGNIIPKLIEMQGFPSLYAHQHAMALAYKKFLNVPDDLTHLFNGHTDASYKKIFVESLLGNHKPENVVLLDIQPDKQKTWVDFADTKEIAGIEAICISDITKEGRDLYYINNGKRTPIYRIYNRLIFDELALRSDLQYAWNLTDEANVEWCSHPNWFFRISKFALPLIRSKYVPRTHYLHTLTSIPDDLENYVLKPLYSFAGSGVKFHVSKTDIENVNSPENFILQEKVNYAPVIQTPDVPAKFEVRLMYIWKPEAKRPELAINLVRLSKGEMIGVNFNKNRTWVGGSVGFFY